MSYRIHVSSPLLFSQEREYVNEALAAGMLSWRGEFVNRFEDALTKVHAVNCALACSSGTTALHLAMLALGVRPGDEVIVPALTYIATANAVRYCGATPVFADVDPATWNVTLESVKACLTTKTVGIIPVHLYGNICDVRSLRQGLPPKLFVVEDAAQAIGVNGLCQYSDVAVFSFFANKVITTGEGGAVLTNNHRLRDRMFHLRGQCVDPQASYKHTDVGYNYRMSNIHAAIGLGQLENLPHHQRRRWNVWQQYYNWLRPHVEFQHDTPGRAHWMITPMFPNGEIKDAVREALELSGIETRPVFVPLHLQVPYGDPSVTAPVSEDIASRGLNIPTHAGMTMADVRDVSEVIMRSLP